MCLISRSKAENDTYDKERHMKVALGILALGTSLTLSFDYAQADSACTGLRGRDLQQAGVAGVCSHDITTSSAAAAAKLLDNDAGDGGSSADDRPDPPANSGGEDPSDPGDPGDPSGDPVDP